MQGRIESLTLQRDEEIFDEVLLGAEQKAALDSLLEQGYFQPVGDESGPYCVRLGVSEGRLIIAAQNRKGADLPILVMSLRPYRKVIDDYFVMIRSFEEMRHTASPAKLEAIDMGRRGLHNEGAELLRERLAGKIDIDFETGRRFFTLICALHRDQLRTMG